MLYNVNRGKRHRARTIADFDLHFGDSKSDKPKQTWQQQKAIGQQMAAMYNQQYEQEERERAKKELQAKARNAQRAYKQKRIDAKLAKAREAARTARKAKEEKRSAKR